MPASRDEFSTHYRTLADEELLSLALQRSELQDEASRALDTELAARGLGADDLHDFEARLSEHTDLETGDGQEELPPPAELPADWFDDVSDSPDQTLAVSRPKGVTVAAYIFWLSGIVGIVAGSWIIFGGAFRQSTLLLASSFVGLLFGVVEFVTGFGLWRLASWARIAALVICWSNVTFLALGIALLAYVRLRGFAIPPWMPISQFFGFLWNLVWALYFGRKNIEEAFTPGSSNKQFGR